MNEAMQTFASEVVANSGTAIQQPSDLFPFLKALVAQIAGLSGNAMAFHNTSCAEAFHAWSTFNLTTFNNNNTLLLYTLGGCLMPSNFSGYVDPYNRLIGGVYVFQTRAQITSCNSQVQRNNPYQGLPGLPCLDPHIEATSFHGLYCDANPTECAKFGSFSFQAQYNAFATMLPVGIPLDDSITRLNALEERGWIDGITKKLCALA